MDAAPNAITRCPNCNQQWQLARLVRGSLGQCPRCGVELYLAPGLSQRFVESVSLPTFERVLGEPVARRTLEPLIARELGLRRDAAMPWAMLGRDGTRLTTARLHALIQRNPTVRSAVYQLYMNLAHDGELHD